jgi:uncharacterized membrane protein
MIDATTVLAIIGMASATFATRALGYVALRNRTLSPRTQAVLEAAPGCVLISVVAPEFVTGNPADLIALVITVIASSRCSMIATVGIGIASAALLRHVLVGH